MEKQFEAFGYKCSICVDSESLRFIFEEQMSRTLQDSIPTQDLLAVTSGSKTGNMVNVHYVVRRVDGTLRVEVLSICGNHQNCEQLKVSIEDTLKKMNRPKRLLVFVNPQSGHKKGLKIYKTQVQPLFDLCGVSSRLIVTQKAGEPQEQLSTQDLSLLDGLVAIGGDGMFRECVNGLLDRLQADAGIDRHDPDARIAVAKIPIGIIPAGSGNFLVKYLHGTHDIETAALKIILGDHLLSNVASVHQGRQLSSYCGLVLEFGLIGDMMHDCEKHRWMGPNRYKIVPVGTLFKRRTVDVEVEYLPEEKSPVQRKNNRHHMGRQVSLPAGKSTIPGVYQRLNSTPDLPKKKQGLKKLDARVYGIDTFVVSLKEKNGDMVPSFGDPALNMCVTKKCQLSKHIKQLTMLQNHKAGCWDFDFVENIKVRGYHVKLTSVPTVMSDNGDHRVQKKYYINCDGEAVRVTHPEFDVRLHQNAIPIFGKAGSYIPGC